MHVHLHRGGDCSDGTALVKSQKEEPNPTSQGGLAAVPRASVLSALRSDNPQVFHVIQRQSRRVFRQTLGSSAPCPGSLRTPPWVAAQPGAQPGQRWAHSQGLPAVFLTVGFHLIALFSLLVFVSFSPQTTRPPSPLPVSNFLVFSVV